MIDVCPRCRIQAPHRPGREHCPRCGGGLQVVADSGRPAPSPGPRPAPRPAQSGPRVYRNRHVRWVARRPPEAIPPRRAPRPDHRARLIPRYVYIPQWGLRDESRSPIEPAAQQTPASMSIGRVLRLLGVVLAASAFVHLLRYVLLVINRDTPLPGWSITVSGALVMLVGTLAVFGFIGVSVVFARWMIDLRADAYRGVGALDPRRRRWVAVLAGVPLVNLVGAPLLLHEVAAITTDVERGVLADRLKRLWVAWVLVNAVALVALIALLIAWFSDTLQAGGNALVLVALSAAVSAAFAFWVAPRLERLFAEPVEHAVPDKRWVAVA